jgi:hypothetical protein
MKKSVWIACIAVLTSIAAFAGIRAAKTTVKTECCDQSQCCPAGCDTPACCDALCN